MCHFDIARDSKTSVTRKCCPIEFFFCYKCHNRIIDAVYVLFFVRAAGG